MYLDVFLYNVILLINPSNDRVMVVVINPLQLATNAHRGDEADCDDDSETFDIESGDETRFRHQELILGLQLTLEPGPCSGSRK